MNSQLLLLCDAYNSVIMHVDSSYASGTVVLQLECPYTLIILFMYLSVKLSFDSDDCYIGIQFFHILCRIKHFQVQVQAP